MIKCKICQCEFDNLRNLSAHITKAHDISTKEYYDKFLIKEEELKWENKRFISFVQGYKQRKLKKDYSNQKEYKCEICGKTFLGERSISSHVRQTHNIKPKDYYDTYLKEENEGICKLCGKPTSYNYFGGYSIYCGNECSALDTVDKCKETMLEKYGAEHFSKTLEYKEQVRNTMLERYGVEHPSQFSNKTSKCELNLLEWVKTLNVELESGKWFFNNNKRYELDIYIPKYKIGIEMDGHYYHTPKLRGTKYHLNKSNWFKENYNIDVIHIVDLEWLDDDNRKEIENIIKYKLSKDKLKENRYINNNVYDRRFFNNLEGKNIKPKLLKFNNLDYEDCGYVEV